MLLSVVLVVAANGCMNDQQPVQSQQQNKKEKIPEYVLTKEIRKNGDGEVKNTVEYNYDDKGHLLEVIYKNSKGEIIEHKKYKYNDQGLKVKRNILEVVEPMNKHRWMSGSYDLSELNKERVVHEDMYMIKGTSKYKYNSQNQLVYFEKRNKEGKKVKWIKFKYYDNGNMKLEHIKRSNGYEEKYYYNKDGKWIKQIKKYDGNMKIEKALRDNYGNTKKIVKIRNGKKVLETKYKNKYDNEGNLVRTIIKDKYDTLIFEYNKEGKKTKYVSKYPDGDIVTWREYKYNEKGKQILWIGKDSEGNIISKCKTKYKYDKHGNLVKVQGVDLLDENQNDGWVEYEYKKIR